MILGADENVVDVAQDAAAGARRDRGHEFPFRNRRVSELHIGGRILNEDSAPERALHLIDMPANDNERLFRHRQRQEIGKISAAADAPGDVLGHQRRLDALGNLADALEMRQIKPLGGAERETDAVQ